MSIKLDVETITTAYVVAVFHTHTPYSNFWQGSRPVGPSEGDKKAADIYELPAIVYDYAPSGTNEIFFGHSIDMDAKLYHTDPDRRPTPDK